MIFFSDPWKRIFLGHADRCGNITPRVVWPSYYGAAGRPARWTKMQAWNSRGLDIIETKLREDMWDRTITK